LGRLGVGLSKAELESANFEEIQARLSVLFAGQASTAANTYAGEIAKLQVAVNNAKETIGKGFVDALKTASGSSTIDPVIAGINSVANAFAYVTNVTPTNNTGSIIYENTRAPQISTLKFPYSLDYVDINILDKYGRIIDATNQNVSMVIELYTDKKGQDISTNRGNYFS
jgi:hypothetical protein